MLSVRLSSPCTSLPFLCGLHRLQPLHDDDHLSSVVVHMRMHHVPKVIGRGFWKDGP